MELLLDTYKKNVRQRPLFTKIIDIDFYDGPTEAVCQLIDSEDWFICSLLYFDPDAGERIFTILEISNESFLEFKSILEDRSCDQSELYKKLKDKAKSIYDTYLGKVFLLKGNKLDSINYQVIQIPLERLKYFNHIEDVLEQSEESKSQWVSLFQV
jgi:hypothetical protein